ncbi:MAG: type II toxin-antitoxin system RelE/ParE family toxin [Oscillospiraceae bacterium]|nr:type II toxin-antitoxin system RelE/ParE family toxin [Oscillospiraceae bacterium]
MDKYEIELSMKAKNDLKSIVSYIKNNLLEPAIAEKYSKLIKERIKSLEYSPEKFALIDTEIVKHTGFRKLVIKNYIVFYRVNNDRKIVNVERILYGGMDWQNML